MKSNRTRLALLIAVPLFILVGLSILGNPELPPPSSVGLKPPRLAPVVPKDFDWLGLDREELRQFTKSYSENQRAGDLVWRGTLSFNETCITSFQEGAPGEFTFTTLTPLRRESSDQSNSIVFDMSTKSIDISGRVGEIVTTQLRVFTAVDRIEGGNMTDTDAGTYHLRVTGPPDTLEASIEMEIRGGYSSPDDPVFGAKKMSK